MLCEAKMNFHFHRARHVQNDNLCFGSRQQNDSLKIRAKHLSMEWIVSLIFVFLSRTFFRCKGIQKLMVPGTSVKSSKEALRLTRLYPGAIYSTAGMWLMVSWDILGQFTNSISNCRYSSAWFKVNCRRAGELARVWIDCKSTGMRCDWTVWPWLSTWLLRTACAENNIRKATATGRSTA